MSVFFNFGEIEKCNSIVPKGHRKYSFFSFKSSIFIKTGETLRRPARGGSPDATSLMRKGGLREIADPKAPFRKRELAAKQTEGFFRLRRDFRSSADGRVPSLRVYWKISGHRRDASA